MHSILLVSFQHVFHLGVGRSQIEWKLKAKTLISVFPWAKIGQNDHSNPYIESTTVLSDIYIYISYVRHFWSRGPRATRKRKPAHLKFKGHMHACCIILGECYALWGERERRAVVSVSNLRCWLSESCCRRSSLSCVVSASNLRLWLML